MEITGAVWFSIANVSASNTPKFLLFPTNTKIIVASGAMPPEYSRSRSDSDSSPVLIVAVPEFGTCTSVGSFFVSPAARDLFGAEPADLLGDYASWLSHVLDDDREVLLAALAQLDLGGGTVTCEYRLGPPGRPATPPRLKAVTPTPADGIREMAMAPKVKQRWVRDTLAPQYGAAGELEGWDGVLSDITEQRDLADDTHHCPHGRPTALLFSRQDLDRQFRRA